MVGRYTEWCDPAFGGSTARRPGPPGDTVLRPPLTGGGDPLRLLQFYARQVTSRCRAHYGFVNGIRSQALRRVRQLSAE